MTLKQFRSILGHEYGHLRNEDTAGGRFAIAVRRSLFVMTLRLAQGGAAAWYNPAWWFVRGFHRVFLRISEGASRLQEVLADRGAALAYGSAAFASGLRHVVERSVRFDAHLQRTLHEVVERKRPLANIYAYQPAESTDLTTEVDEHWHREASAYDSHPPPDRRVAWVTALDAPDVVSPDDDEPVWSLFSDREELEREMTREVRENVAVNHGVYIDEEEKPTSTTDG
jgi:Zn-dependent protease with chaperone function